MTRGASFDTRMPGVRCVSVWRLPTSVSYCDATFTKSILLFWFLVLLLLIRSLKWVNPDMHVKIAEISHWCVDVCDVRDKLLEKQKKQRENVTERVKAWKTFLLIQANQMSADGNPLKIKGASSHCRLGCLWSEEGENWTFNRFRKKFIFTKIIRTNKNIKQFNK